MKFINFLKILYNSEKMIFLSIIFYNIIIGIFPGLSLFILNKIIYYKNLGNNNVLYFLLILIAIHLGLKIILSDYVLTLGKKFHYLAMKHINILIFNKIDELSYKRFEDSLTYDLLQQVKQDSTHRPQTIIYQFSELIVNIFTFFSFCIVLFTWDIFISIILCFFIAIPLLFLRKLEEIEYKKDLKRLENQRKYYYISFILSSFQFIKELRVYAVTKYFINRYDKIFYMFKKQDKIFYHKRNIYSSVILLLSVIPLIIFNLYILNLIIKNLIDGSIFFILIQTSILLHSSIHSIIICKTKLYESKLYIEKLFQFLNLNEDKDDKIDFLNINSILKKENYIEFKNVYFRYDSRSSYILENINLKIKSGECVAIVGSNGSGKTTLIKILLRLYEPSSGEILFNDVNIAKISKQSWYNFISILFQDFNKYELPLYQNIILNKKFIKQKFSNALDNSDLDNFVKILPNDYNTKLGVLFHNGTELSGGQWQKVALARAYYKGGGLIILDEPTSAVDPSSESNIIDYFYQNKKTNISILITHRMNHVTKASRIIVLKDGKIIEQGKHKFLLSLKGVYSQYFYIQNPKNSFEDTIYDS